MPYGRKIILHCLAHYHAGLDQMIEQFIKDGVAFVNAHSTLGIASTSYHLISRRISFGQQAAG